MNRPCAGANRVEAQEVASSFEQLVVLVSLDGGDAFIPMLGQKRRGVAVALMF